MAISTIALLFLDGCAPANAPCSDWNFWTGCKGKVWDRAERFTPPKPARPEERTESQNVFAVRLMSTTPPGLASDPAKSIVLSRNAKYGWFELGGQWRPSNSVSYAADGLIGALDRGLGFGFSLTPLELTGLDPSTESSTQLHGLSLFAKNASTSSATIDWNTVSIVGNGGKAYPVTHRGIRYAAAAAPMASSTIPPSATLEDFVFPRENIVFATGRYGGWSGRAFFETMRPGDTFTLFLPVKRGQETVEYQFAFEITAPLALTHHIVVVARA